MSGFNYDEYLKKKRCRGLSRYALRTKKIEKFPCKICGDINSQMHHEDYLKPLSVVWLCDKHHRELHKSQIK